MKRTPPPVVLAIAASAAIAFLAGNGPGLAQEGIDKTKAAAFDNQLFAGPLGQKAYACFVRRYDANHLAQHPKQKVSAMKLLVTAENPPEEKITNYSFRIGVKYRHRPGNFDSSGYCSHVAEDKGNAIRFGCGVDCEGGGIGVAMKDDKSAVIRLARIRIWERNKADDDASKDLVAGADDRVFRVDRAELRECAELVTDRKELAALRRKGPLQGN
ncbi:hypothetical protein LJR220_001820 [Bradyrhizobium sp. LjRoot220]|uniref:hypothetical protein n=1 Tax=Bradyrhizobium sp. LjRoot220 TaxID=3342284 RepID=UPI003ECE7F74